MDEAKEYIFGPFRLNATKEQLWRDEEEIRLAPKVFAVLRYLLEHPGELVSKEMFFQSVWPGVYVTDTVLAVHIGKTREALGDDPKDPSYIETVHRRGYRFIGQCSVGYQTPPSRSNLERHISKKPIVSEPATTIGSQPLVGREAELSFLQEKLSNAVNGMGSLVFISGPAGIGKTRLARELRDYTVKSGFRWLEGRYDKAANQPYQAWVEMIRRYFQQTVLRPPENLDENSRVQLAKLVPEIVAMPAPSEPITADPETDRLKLFEAVAHFFLDISQREPVVLFMDDLQWAASLELLHHLARHIGNQPVLILATYRDEEIKNNSSLWGTILAMNRERLFHSVPLAPLSVSEVESLISSRVDREVAAQLAGLVYRKTEGNPFFIEEVLRLLQERKALFVSKSGWRVADLESLETPESVKVVINARLERLGENAEELLRVASVIGREFPLSLLKELMGYEDDRLIETLDRCEGAALIFSQQTGGEEIYSFSHDMMQEALYESIGPARRRRHHLRVGLAIEKFFGSRLEDWYEALGKHFFEGNEPAKAVDYSLKAGDRASAVCSWGRASDHYQTAFEILEELKADPREQAEVLEKLALATMWFGRGGDSLGQWKKALSIYETLDDKKKAGAVHLRLYQQYYSAIGPRDREKGYRHCVEALSLLESEGDSVELAQAYTRLGLISAHRQNVPLSTGIDPLEKGLALARRLGNPATIAEADMSLGHVLVYHAGEIKRGLEFADEAYEAAQKSGDTVLLADTAIRAAEDYLILLDTDQIWRWAEKAVTVSNQSGLLRHQIQSTLLHVWAYILWGETQQALLSLETAQRMAKTAGVEFTQMPRPPARLAAIIVPFFAGDWDKCETELLKWQDWPSDVVLVLIAWVSGWLSLEKGDLAQAKARLREALNRCEIRGEKTLAVAPLALLSQVTSKAGELAESAAYLRRAQEITSPSQDWRGLFGEVLVAEAMLHASEKRWEKANRAFQEAAEIYQRYNTPYYQARALFEWAKMYALRKGRVDRKRAGELFDRSLQIFEAIQAKKMLQKVQAEKRSLVI